MSCCFKRGQLREGRGWSPVPISCDDGRERNFDVSGGRSARHSRGDCGRMRGRERTHYILGANSPKEFGGVGGIWKKEKTGQTL